MSAALLSVTPMIPAGADLEADIAFYVGQMGFALLWQTGDMAGIRRDGIAFNLVRNTNRNWADNSSFSIGVSDLDALYEEYRNLPGRVGPLEMKSWGQREFHIIVPTGVCFQFYQAA